MKGAIQRLRAEIASDRHAFDQRVQELSGLVRALPLGGPPALAQMAVALHHGYGALEGAMSRVCRFFEGELPAGPDWHQTLLCDMGLELPGVRPAILGPDAIALLRRLFGFRHFFRHAYAVELDAERLAQLAREAEQAQPLIARDFLVLDTLLATVAAREQE